MHWTRRFILHHGTRHPRDLGTAEVEQFLTHLAVEGRVSASTQNQALNALVFLYGQILDLDLGRLDSVRARRGQRLPVVLAPEEVARVLARIDGAAGAFSLMARLLYGCGLRLLEFRSIQVLLGHESLETTMIYTHVARKGVVGVTSPLDLLGDVTGAEFAAAVAANERGGIAASGGEDSIRLRARPVEFACQT